MRYESEILYDLMKRDGLLNPSQENLPYESELKEKYVNDVVGAYPKLQDYRPEWLNYNKCEHIPADFPTESQTNQTSGTFENVIPFGYDVATLKGQTLVNIKTKYNSSPTAGSWAISVYDINSLKINTKYLIKVFNKTNIDVVFYPSSQNSTGLEFEAKANSIGVGTITTNAKITNDIMLRLRSSSEDVIGFDCNILLLEYQEGMENWNIPYFEGMQSVQMPVLTTTGKNLFNKNDLNLNYALSSVTGNLSPQSNRHATKYITIKSNTNYIVSNMSIAGNCFYDKDKNFISFTSKTSFISPENAKYLRTSIKNEIDFQTGQIEEGSTATSYEPYQSIIVSTPSDLELRGIGGVKDTLDLTTGELTQRIDEVVLNGQGNWKKCGSAYQPTDTNYICYDLTVNDIKPSTQILCDTINTRSWNIAGTNLNSRSIAVHSTNKVLRLCIEKTIAPDVDSLKTYLSTNIAKVQYRLANESIKTVDISCINENNVECDFIPFMDTMHYQTSSNTFPPLVDLTVCVEATTQNLASFVDLEGVEHDG